MLTSLISHHMLSTVVYYGSYFIKTSSNKPDFLVPESLGTEHVGHLWY